MQVDSHVVARARAGDREAVAALYRACAPKIHRWIRARIRDHHTAEDLTQQTFANALRALPRFEHREGGFHAWLRQIAHNALIDHVRTNQKYALQADPAAFRAAPGGRAEAADALRDALSELGPAQCEVTVLRHVVGLAPREIARRTGRSVSSVDALHHRGRKALQRALVEREVMPCSA